VLELRSFQPDDYDALISWFPSEAALQDWAGPGLRWPLDHAQLVERLAEPGLRAWTACQAPSTETVGHIELMETAPQQGRIDRVAVAPAYRGRRLGPELVRAALEQARDRGYVAVDLLVFAGNVPACRTYLSVGFIDVGPISPEYPTVRRMSTELPR
jgi:ribosomal protein S18 acetylase RimI-like enzyme